MASDLDVGLPLEEADRWTPLVCEDTLEVDSRRPPAPLLAPSFSLARDTDELRRIIGPL
jgi:hypothetical protein